MGHRYIVNISSTLARMKLSTLQLPRIEDLPKKQMTKCFKPTQQSHVLHSLLLKTTIKSFEFSRSRRTK